MVTKEKIDDGFFMNEYIRFVILVVRTFGDYNSSKRLDLVSKVE